MRPSLLRAVRRRSVEHADRHSCLVKMQKRGQDACPSCRAPVVLRADATNLDAAMQDFLLRWFVRARIALLMLTATAGRGQTQAQRE